MEALARAPEPAVVPYDPARDYPLLAEWWLGHGGLPEPEWALPPVGRVALGADGTGLGAAFLLEVAGTRVCQMHQMVSNPAAGPRAVRTGLDAVVAALVGEAVARGYRAMWAVTRVRSVVRLMARHGFRADGSAPGWVLLGRML